MRPLIATVLMVLMLLVRERDSPDLADARLRRGRRTGWEHRGPCHSSEAHPDGLKPNGSPCEWYR
jgi:hypothetical protein